MRAERYAPPVAFHAEGPVWWPDDGSAVSNTLRYVDMMAGRILTVHTDDVHGDRVDALDVPGPVAACIRPRPAGGIVVLTEHGVSVSDDASGGPWRESVGVITDPGVRFNDGGCDPTGAFYVGSMRYDQAVGGATLYRVSPAAEVDVALGEVTVSNGIAWSADGELAYYDDTPTRSTWVYDWSPEGGLQEPRRLFTLDGDDPGAGPDGLCMDAEGNVWTAIYGGSRVDCHDPSGALVDRVELPVTNVTACTFGGPGLETLFVTTTRENVPEGAEPDAGAVYAITPGVRGVPVTPFAG